MKFLNDLQPDDNQRYASINKELDRRFRGQTVDNIIKQVSKFISFEGENAAIIVNNGDWILDLNYMDFIRTYGVYPFIKFQKLLVMC